VAVSASVGEIADARDVHELFERLRNGRMKASRSLNPRGQHGFEGIEALLERTDLSQLVTRGGGRPAPQLVERRMTSRELVGRHAEQGLGRAWTKLRANGTERLRDLADVEGIPGAANDSLADSVPGGIADRGEQAQRIVGEAVNKVHLTGRKDMLAPDSGRASLARFVNGPEGLDDVTERRPGHTSQHHFIDRISLQLIVPRGPDPLQCQVMSGGGVREMPPSSAPPPQPRAETLLPLPGLSLQWPPVDAFRA
jgi:hypothetical protein